MTNIINDQTILYHRTSFSKAISILWNKEIWGGGGGGIHEKYAHFYIKDEYEDIQQAKSNQVILKFSSNLPIKVCSNNIPVEDVINKHFDLEPKFWQATITPNKKITYLGAKVVSHTEDRILRKILLKLSKKIIGAKISTSSIDNHRKKPPYIFKVIIYIATGIGNSANS